MEELLKQAEEILNKTNKKTNLTIKQKQLLIKLSVKIYKFLESNLYNSIKDVLEKTNNVLSKRNLQIIKICGISHLYSQFQLNDIFNVLNAPRPFGLNDFFNLQEFKLYVELKTFKEIKGFAQRTKELSVINNELREYNLLFMTNVYFFTDKLFSGSIAFDVNFPEKLKKEIKETMEIINK